MRVGVGVRGDDRRDGVAVIGRDRRPTDRRGQGDCVRMRAVIGRRPVALLTLVRLPMLCGVGIRVALPNYRARVAACHGGARERSMKLRVRLQGERRLERRDDRRAKNNQGKEAAEHVKSKVEVVRFTKNERGTAVLVVQF